MRSYAVALMPCIVWSETSESNAVPRPWLAPTEQCVTSRKPTTCYGRELTSGSKMASCWYAGLALSKWLRPSRVRFSSAIYLQELTMMYTGSG